MKKMLAFIGWVNLHGRTINRTIILFLTVFDLYLANLIFEPELFSKVLASLNHGLTSITTKMSEFDSKQRAIIADFGSPIPTSTTYPSLSPSLSPSPMPSSTPALETSPSPSAASSATPIPSPELSSPSPSVSPDISPSPSDSPSPTPSVSPTSEPEEI